MDLRPTTVKSCSETHTTLKGTNSSRKLTISNKSMGEQSIYNRSVCHTNNRSFTSVEANVIKDYKEEHERDIGSLSLPTKIMSTLYPRPLLNSHSHLSSGGTALQTRQDAQLRYSRENLNVQFQERIRKGTLYKELLDKGIPEVVAFRRQQLYFSAFRLNRFEVSDMSRAAPRRHGPNAA